MRSTYLAGALLLATDAATAYSLTLPSRPMAVTAPAARRSAAALIKMEDEAEMPAEEPPSDVEVEAVVEPEPEPEPVEPLAEPTFASEMPSMDMDDELELY